MESQLIPQFDQLIQTGEDVVATRRPPGRGVIAADFVDSAMFEQWRTSSLSLLKVAFTENSVHFKEFTERCQGARHHDAVSGLAILKAARNDIEGDIDLTQRQHQIELQDLPLHRRIVDVCLELYRDGHYSNAVLDASKALINFVKERSRRDDLDGADLMRTVFSKNHPVLAFNNLTDQSDLDEQEGMMHLFEGAVLGIRNPRGHDFLNDSPERALEYICLISLLANRLEEAHRK